jgi:hypothetical protein
VSKLTSQITAGDKSVSASDLANANQSLEHAELVHQGAEATLGPAQKAYDAAVADAFADSIVAEIPGVAYPLTEALGEFLGAALRVRETGEAYDRLIAWAAQRVVQMGQASPRVVLDRRSFSKVDSYEIRSCNWPAQMCAVLVSVLTPESPTYLVNDCQTLAAKAPRIPSA